MSKLIIKGKVFDLNKITYSEIVGLINERNRPSGGLKTIQEVVVNSFINESKKVLEVGSNTGFTSVNLSLLAGCKVVGLEILHESVIKAKKYAKEQGVSGKVRFIKGDVLALPFENNYFDAVWCSNVTSFIEDKEKAVREYIRVLKNNGFLIVVPIYYKTSPPNDLLNKVSRVIGSKLKIFDKEYWEELFIKTAEDQKIFLEKIYENDYLYLDREKLIPAYVDTVMAKKHLNILNEDNFKLLKDKFSFFIKLFNENLKYAKYSIFIYQKRNIKDEKELFITYKA